MEKYEILKFTDSEFELDVNVSPEEDTVWLTKDQIALLFDRDRTVITRHINKIYQDDELDQESTCAKNAQVQLEGLRNVKREINYYNLDVILSVGYRVNSKRGILFRKWATNVLRQYLLNGYSLNSNRIIISKDNYLQLESDVALLKEEVADIKEKVFVEPVKQKIFFDGAFFDAYDFITSLINKANRKVVIIDPYFDEKGLNVLRNTSKEVTRIICLSEKAKLSDYDVEQFKKQYGGIQIITRRSFHDRFLIIDSECYILGTSLNYMGDKTFGINKIEDEKDIEGILKRIKD